MAKKLHEDETKRIVGVFDLLKKRMSLDLNLIISPFSKTYLARYPHSLFTIESSLRQGEDPTTFCIRYNPEKTSILTQNEIKRHALHELFHTFQEGMVREWEAVAAHINNTKLLKELRARELMARENMVYALERKTGPFIIPECNWKSEE